MIKNNLSWAENKIPEIAIKPFDNWKNTIAIFFNKKTSRTDLYITVKSYADSQIIIPIQMLVLVKNEEENITFFSESIDIKKINIMSLSDFCMWHTKIWEKDAKYVGHECFQHTLVFKYVTFDERIHFPIYPWKKEILEEVIKETATKDSEIYALKQRIKNLEDEIFFLKKKD